MHSRAASSSRSSTPTTTATATELGQAAAEDGVDLVVVHGGDGTVSGVVNGLLGRPGSTRSGHVPAVAVVPGGSANVLARSLGISRDPVAATNQLIQLIDDYRRHQTWRRISLIDCGEQWAVINAGMGVDAEVVAAVEAQRKKGVKVTPLRYWRVAVPATLGYRRRAPEMMLELPGRDPVSGVQFAWVSNTTPWTYSNSRPLVTNPGCSFESGLGVFAVTSMKVIPTLRLLRQILVEATEAGRQTACPRRRHALPANHLQRRAGRQPVRRGVPRAPRFHDVPRRARCARGGGAAAKKRP